MKGLRSWRRHAEEKVGESTMRECEDSHTSAEAAALGTDPSHEPILLIFGRSYICDE